MSTNRVPLLANPLLGLAAEVLDDVERVRIANENRYKELTRGKPGDAPDADGELRGWGLDNSHPDVARLAALVEMLRKVEKRQATRNLERIMRHHPLEPWRQQHRGVGEKQLARLLAKIGDPYWNTQYNRPRTVSELWAYCGYHTLPTSQAVNGTLATLAGGADSAGSDQGSTDTPPTYVAARRKRGERANWSNTAKMRAYLIAESCMKSGDNPYRDVYDKRKAATLGRTHAVACVRCGPKGKPAQPGSPWSDGHRHADALRIAAKTLLRDLWVESKRLHEQDT